MDNQVIKLFFVIQIGFAPALSWAEAKSITLEQAINIGFGENFDIKTSERELDASEARLKRTRSYFLPRLGVESRYEYFDSSFQRQTGATADLYLEWNLFNGFRDWYDRKAKSFDLDQTRVGVTRQKLETKSAIEAKFYKLLAISESIKAYEEALVRNESQRGSAKKRRQAGLVSDTDIFEFDLYQTDLQAEIVRLKSDYKQAQAEFRELLGQNDQALEYSPKGVLAHYHIDDRVEDLKKRTLADSQAIIAAKSAIDQAEANKKVVAGGYLPQLDIKASYGSRGINETLVSPETAIMGVAKWEFFSGFDTYHARGESSAQAAKAAAALARAELFAKSQVEIAYTQLRAIQERVDIETENRVKARKFFDIMAGEYQRGVKNSADMRAAAQILLQIILRDIQYRAEFFQQKANLEKAVGGTIQISKGSEHGHKD